MYILSLDSGNFSTLSEEKLVNIVIRVILIIVIIVLPIILSKLPAKNKDYYQN